MHYFIKVNKDSYITENSPGHIVQFEDSTLKNYGKDEILELKKVYTNEYATEPFQVSRILTSFNYTDDLIPQLQVSGGLIPSESAKYNLRYYEVEGQKELNKTYSLSSHTVYQNWEEGVGKKFDNPKSVKGVTWKDYVSGSSWAYSENLGVSSGSRTAGGGVWYTGSNASQSFLNQSGDIEMDVTDIVNNHLESIYSNYGIILKFSGSSESDDNPLDLKFFSKDTHTIYSPKLEVKWNDCSYPNPMATTLNYITMSGEIKNHIFIKGLQPTYREGDRVRFRMGCRKKYVTKTFTDSVLTSSFYVPKGSGSYSIVDSSTNEDVISFSAYTSMSADTTSMYFDQWFDNWEKGRYYKILFKLKYEDGTTQIIDNNEEFRIV
tara:strand:- start:939 stop:2072 length:1134 start_codon:yes stop_codon:yes gene_type:complete